MLRVLVAVEEAAGAQVLRLLADTSHRVVAVLTSGLVDLATRLGNRIWSPSLVTKAAFAGRVRSEQVDLLLTVHSPCVVHDAVVAAPRLGSFNLHPGPLPAHAGLNAPSWAIYNGERSHATTLHWMRAGGESGQIAYSAPVSITSDDTGYTLSAKCVRAGVPLVAKLLSGADAVPPYIPRIPPPVGGRRRVQQGAPHAGLVPWGESAQSILDLLRAADFGPFPSPWGQLSTRVPGAGEVVVLKVSRTGQPVRGALAGTVGERIGDEVLVAAADEWLCVCRVRVGGRDAPPARILPAGARLAWNDDRTLRSS